MSDKQVLKTWKGNQNNSVVLTIPNKIARECSLDSSTYVTIESNEKTITIKKLDLNQGETG